MKRCEVGGQAVIEGVMMRGGKGQATAVRTPKNKIEVEFEKVLPITKRKKYLNIPFIRGVFILIDSLVTGIKTLNYSASFFEEDEEPSKFEEWLKRKLGDKANDIIIGVTLAFSMVLAMGLFIAIPTGVASIFKGLGFTPIILNLIEAMIRISILLIYIYGISKMEDIYRVFQYHGAEHKTIFCYEAEEKLTVENVKKFSRFHPRCGTNFLFLIMFVSIIIFTFTGWGNFAQRLILRIVLIPVVSGITYEIIRWLGKNDSSLAKVIAYPGLKLQELTTKEPDNDQIEVAIAALMRAEGIEMKNTIGKLIDSGVKILKDNNIETYILDTQLLLGKVLKKDKLYLITHRDEEVGKEDENSFFDLLGKRKEKMPMKYILGESEFMGLDFYLEEGVLIPRGDTEILVEEVLKLISESDKSKVCDLCCGSGAIGIALAYYRKNIKVDAIDYYDTPQKVTIENIKRHSLQERVNFIKSDLLGKVIESGEKYDYLVSNPPYIREDVIETLMDDVKKYEPHTALSGGKDGLDFYKRIIKESKYVLNSNGILAFEIGYDQAEDLEELMKEENFINIKVIKDLAGLDRVIIGNFHS
ncbi:peptide chain release factor N(5)-glutamine methyltransferase [Clostridium septicum]|uniref:Release factor glutamine methyltransferase n=1 Tax=Clostridium septicum TaxID=1504 RepID=A0A9N7JLM1_CLOSE|nr:peptide chain release factor N(5)-glutamine methyltransferase [Clostridium septicum]AYE34728.1 protein-(glutamine-N5) methyltransferase, release factor-specific [Clostridium septicum]MDU1312763.1 peptide chain release factor N(5)-glutamine methyltransferase [Clostridium septicum]QAS60129.1 peptide chain release factor N(5)-glutamine methyltransferase [Clostridium septicum]UEC20625.1 peptide chain release factor N(5)-glutamine methyltransferase [Clostridium septicum]USS01323.1 peptide chain 